MDKRLCASVLLHAWPRPWTDLLGRCFGDKQNPHRVVRRDEEKEARTRRQSLNGTGTTREYGRNETWRAKNNGCSGKGEIGESRKLCKRWEGGFKKGVMSLLGEERKLIGIECDEEDDMELMRQRRK